MIRTVLKMGTPSLLQVSDPILEHEFDTLWLRELVDDMVETMRERGGVGLAAPQVGVNRCVVVIEYTQKNSRYPDVGDHELEVIINPLLQAVGHEESAFMEGCLSIPGLRGEVDRPVRITYRYQDLSGKVFEGESEGFFARVLQHECDHLGGILYPMRMRDMKTFRYTDLDS